MELESGSERFRFPKTSFQENVLVNDAVPASIKYKNKWAVSIFAEWQRLREIKVPVLDCGGLFKDYDFHKVTALSADIAGMAALSLNYWLSKFVMEVAKKSGGRYPPKTFMVSFVPSSVIWRRKMDPKLSILWTLVTKGTCQLLDRLVQNFKMHCFGNWIWCVVFRRFVLFRRCRWSGRYAVFSIKTD